MTTERLIEIMQDQEIKTEFPKDADNALCGLNLIAKYLPKRGIEGAEHDVIYACDADELAEAGITEEDAVQLRTWNWMYDEDAGCLACFV
jgi:hypothetical protein